MFLSWSPNKEKRRTQQVADKRPEKMQFARIILSRVSSSIGRRVVLLTWTNVSVYRDKAMKMTSAHARISNISKVVNLPMLSALTQLFIHGQ